MVLYVYVINTVFALFYAGPKDVPILLYMNNKMLLLYSVELHTENFNTPKLPFPLAQSVRYIQEIWVLNHFSLAPIHIPATPINSPSQLSHRPTPFRMNFAFLPIRHSPTVQ